MKFKEFIELFDPENDNPDDAPQQGHVPMKKSNPKMVGINSSDAASKFLRSKGYKSNGEPTDKAEPIPEKKPQTQVDPEFLKKILAAKRGN